MKEIFVYICIAGIFLSAAIPLLMGVVYYYRENKRLDELEKSRKQ